MIFAEQRELLLVPFPFSDQSNKKVRPVVVVSNNKFNKSSEDLIVIGITSNISNDEYTVEISGKDLDEGELSDNCCIKVENILKIDRRLVIKKIGKLKIEKFRDVLNKISSIIREE